MSDPLTTLAEHIVSEAFDAIDTSPDESAAPLIITPEGIRIVVRAATHERKEQAPATRTTFDLATRDMSTEDLVEEADMVVFALQDRSMQGDSDLDLSKQWQFFVFTTAIHWHYLLAKGQRISLSSLRHMAMGPLILEQLVPSVTRNYQLSEPWRLAYQRR